MHGRRFAKRGGIAANTPAAWPPRERGRPLSSVSSTAAGEGAHGWGRARDGVESPWMSWRIAQGWRALRTIPCRRPLASAGAGKFESAASTLGGSLRSAGSLEPAGWVFRIGVSWASAWLGRLVCHFALQRGVCGLGAQTASTSQRFRWCSKLLLNQALTRPRW